MKTARHQHAAQPISTRRTFLKASAVAVSAVAASRLVVPRYVHAAGAEEIRIGMIGCGGRCSGAARCTGPGEGCQAGGHVRRVSEADGEHANTSSRICPISFVATDETCRTGWTDTRP